MHVHPITPCLWFAEGVEAAAAWYAGLFPGSAIVARGHYPDAIDNPAGRPRGGVMTIELELAGQRFTLLEGGPAFRPGPSISFFVMVEDHAEVDRLADALLEGGKAMMPLDAYPWSPRYAWIEDRHGVSWQVMAKEGPTAIIPCLMFSGAQHGHAEEALRRYTSIFPGSEIVALERYAAGEGHEGMIKHGRCHLGGQPVVAMDGHTAHDLSFTEGVSLQVTCEDQAEVDRFWAALSEGGKPGPCGWLHDRFGVSWQIVPADIRTWMSSPDAAARDRAFAAMMKMSRPDIAALEAAFAG